MNDERPLCDHQVDVDDQTWFNCELPVHHTGDHAYTYTWENEPIGPSLPPRVAPQHAPTEWLADAYRRMGAQYLQLALQGSPLLNRKPRERVVNRDAEGAPTPGAN